MIHDRWVGKRIGVSGDGKSLRNWIERRGEAAGFSIVQLTLAQAGYAYVNKTGKVGQGQRLRSVRYEGILSVTDADKFLAAVVSGIGPAKAFGFGLLSIARA